MTVSTLIIWNNKLYGGHKYPGHASLSIDSKWKRQEQQASYVSWWPDTDKTKTTWVRPVKPLTLGLDLVQEGFAPDHIMEIENLNTAKMLNKWTTLKNAPDKKYSMARHNCANMVATILKEGSQGGNAWQRHSVVWTPLKVMRLGHALGGREITWIAFLQRLLKDGWLDPEDVLALSKLYKRDAMHGKNGTMSKFHFRNGECIEPRHQITFKNFVVNKGRPVAPPVNDGCMNADNLVDAIN